MIAGLDPIARDHLARLAVVHVHQSSPGQVRENVESTRIQLGLREKASKLGWRSPLVITEDLGISATGFADRPGFQGLLTRVALREVGIIFSIEAGRLSRNTKDWVHFFELCGSFNTLIADDQQIYNLSRPNDRLLLGIKGSISEMELGLLQGRLQRALVAKAARGELRVNLSAGYLYDASDRINFDPDKRFQAAVQTMFEQFQRSTSMRQLALWYRTTKTLFPCGKKAVSRETLWSIPGVNSLHNLLRHPIYAGAYVWGRRSTRMEYVDGKLVKRSKETSSIESCQVCIRNHHPAYISWAQFVENCARIVENGPRWSMQQNQGAIREGLALLAGVLRCGHCGSKRYVAYKKHDALDFCAGGGVKGTKRCSSFCTSLIDQRVGAELCRALEPQG